MRRSSTRCTSCWCSAGRSSSDPARLPDRNDEGVPGRHGRAPPRRPSAGQPPSSPPMPRSGSRPGQQRRQRDVRCGLAVTAGPRTGRRARTAGRPAARPAGRAAADQPLPRGRRSRPGRCCSRRAARRCSRPPDAAGRRGRRARAGAGRRTVAAVRRAGSPGEPVGSWLCSGATSRSMASKTELTWSPSAGELGRQVVAQHGPALTRCCREKSFSASIGASEPSCR